MRDFPVTLHVLWGQWFSRDDAAYLSKKSKNTMIYKGMEVFHFANERI